MNAPRLTVPLLLVSAALAQSHTAPPDYLQAEAAGRSDLPFGTVGSMRCQFLYDRSMVGPLGTVAILHLRGDAGHAHAALQNVDVQIEMSNTSADPFAPDVAFANNRGSDHQVTFSRRSLNLPALNGGGTPPLFEVHLPMDRPLAFHGPTLLVEFVAWQNDPTGAGYFLDAPLNTQAQYAEIGASCQGPSLLTINAQAVPQNRVLQHAVAGGSLFRNGSALVLLGSQQLPTPLALPGGCLLHQNILLMQPLALDATGAGRASWPLPIDARGRVIYGQAITVDATLSRVGATQCERVVLGGYHAIGQVFSQTGVNAAGGLPGPGFGLVLGFN